MTERRNLLQESLATIERLQARLKASERAGAYADRHRRRGLPLPRRRGGTRGAVAAGPRRRRRGQRGSARSLGRRRLLRPRPQGFGQDGHQARRLSVPSRPLRSAVLRHLAARSGDHGPAAATAARDGLRSARERRHRHRSPRRQRHRRVRRHHDERLRAVAAHRRPRELRRLLRYRQRLERGRRAARLHFRPAGPVRGGRHGMLVVAGGGAPGLPEPAHWRERPGPGRRCERGLVARRDGAVFQVGHDGAGRRLQDLRRRRRRLRTRGRLRCHRAQAAVRCARGGRPHPRGDPRLGRQFRRPQQRPYRAQRAGAAGGAAFGAGQRRIEAGRHRLRRSARHRHLAGRSHRGRGPGGGDARRPHAGPAVADRLDQDQHRACRGGLRVRRSAEGRDVAAPRSDSAAPALQPAQPGHPLGRTAHRRAHGADALAARRPASSRWRELVRI